MTEATSDSVLFIGDDSLNDPVTLEREIRHLSDDTVVYYNPRGDFGNAVTEALQRTGHRALAFGGDWEAMTTASMAYVFSGRPKSAATLITRAMNLGLDVRTFDR